MLITRRWQSHSSSSCASVINFLAGDTREDTEFSRQRFNQRPRPCWRLLDDLHQRSQRVQQKMRAGCSFSAIPLPTAPTSAGLQRAPRRSSRQCRMCAVAPPSKGAPKLRKPHTDEFARTFCSSTRPLISPARGSYGTCRPRNTAQIAALAATATATEPAIRLFTWKRKRQPPANHHQRRRQNRQAQLLIRHGEERLHVGH